MVDFGITNLAGAYYRGVRLATTIHDALYLLFIIFIISKPADAHEEKKRHSNKIESCGSAAVKTGKGRIMSPLRVGGGRFGLSARGQNSDINTHAPKEKREEDDYDTPPSFALLLGTRALSSNKNKYKSERAGAPSCTAGFGQSAHAVKILTSLCRKRKIEVN